MTERKYTGTELAKALTTSHYDSNGYNHAFSYDDIMTLALAWAVHPKFPSPNENTICQREIRHGEMWIKLSEIPSFQLYIGYNLRRYLD